jgi:hypothetical protein
MTDLQQAGITAKHIVQLVPNRRFYTYFEPVPLKKEARRIPDPSSLVEFYDQKHTIELTGRYMVGSRRFLGVVHDGIFYYSEQTT